MWTLFCNPFQAEPDERQTRNSLDFEDDHYDEPRLEELLWKLPDSQGHHKRHDTLSTCPMDEDQSADEGSLRYEDEDEASLEYSLDDDSSLTSIDKELMGIKHKEKVLAKYAHHSTNYFRAMSCVSSCSDLHLDDAEDQLVVKTNSRMQDRTGDDDNHSFLLLEEEGNQYSCSCQTTSSAPLHLVVTVPSNTKGTESSPSSSRIGSPDAASLHSALTQLS